MNPAKSSAYARLVAAAAGLKVPDAVREVANASPQDPEPTQIWRAVWEETTQLLLITTVSDDLVQAVPISLERYADTDTLRLPASASTLELPLALWWGLQLHLPWHVLDRQVSQLTVPLPASNGLSGPQQVPTDAVWGSAVPPHGAAAEYRGVLADSFARLSRAQWAPHGAGDLPDLLQQRGITIKQLASHLNLQPPQALALRRGQAPLTFEQAGELAPVLGLSVEQILAANPTPPRDVIHELSRPSRRPQLRAFAARTNTSESDARRQAAFGIYALAARQEGSTTDWGARADRYFELHLH
ncbi:helix-turn-helix domain-containing protein [Streptomyces sp. NPDC055085]